MRAKTNFFDTNFGQKCKFWENAACYGPSGKKKFLPHEKAKFFVYWTFVCDQVYGQDTGSKTVNFGHFLQFPYWKWWPKWLKLTVFDPVS